MRKSKSLSQEALKSQILRLQMELEEVKETLRAIQNDEVDALVVSGVHGEKIFTLQTADHPYRMLVETMSEGAATLNQDGTVFYCNQRFSEMLETPLESLIGSSLFGFISSSESAEFTNLFGEGKKARSKAILLMRTSRGNFIPTHLSMSAVEIEGRPGVCLLATDLTEHRRFEESRADVERLNIEKDLRERFVSTLSHDLRNPLAAARIHTQMILRSNLAEKFLVLGNKIVKNIDRADVMIQNLLDANRIRAGELLPLEVTSCDLRQIIQETLEELSAVHGDRFIFKTSGPIIGSWSSPQLRRAIENLVNNAIKYGGADTPVTLKLSEERKKVTLSIHNSGSYLTQTEQDGLFKPFVRTLGAVASGTRGWGLGLTLVRGVIEAHGGVIQVQSSVHLGTTFLVTMPRADILEFGAMT